MDAEDFARAWSNYVERQLASRDLTNKEVGEVVGVSPSTIGNWRHAKGLNRPSGENVIDFWRHFGEGSTLPEAMAAAGFGRVEEYDTVIRTVPDPALLETSDLLEQIRIRTESGPLATATRRGVSRSRFRARPDAPAV